MAIIKVFRKYYAHVSFIENNLFEDKVLVESDDYLDIDRLPELPKDTWKIDFSCKEFVHRKGVGVNELRERKSIDYKTVYIGEKYSAEQLSVEKPDIYNSVKKSGLLSLSVVTEASPRCIMLVSGEDVVSPKDIKDGVYVGQPIETPEDVFAREI